METTARSERVTAEAKRARASKDELEALMARGRAAGVTQLVASEIGADGCRIRLGSGHREVRAFATCSYLGLDRDARLATAAIEAIQRCGVAFSASRCFITSPLYEEADALLAQIFGRPVVLCGSTTLAHGAALPILLEPTDVVLYDHQVHHSVQTALTSLGSRGPKRVSVGHADWDRLEGAIRDATSQGARRVWYCADGIYSMFGDRLRTDVLAQLMRRHECLWAYLDDAHGMSWTGTRGGGSLVDAGLPPERTVIATSLSKAFGCAGGLLVVPDVETKQRIENLGPSLMFSIQLPPPVLGAICASARIHLSEELPALQEVLASRLALARSLLSGDEVLRARAPVVGSEPTPVHYLVVGAGEGDDAVEAATQLIARGFLVNPVAFPAVPQRMGGLRFSVSRAHGEQDIRDLFAAIREVVGDSGGTREATGVTSGSPMSSLSCDRLRTMEGER